MRSEYLLRFDDVCPTMNWEAWSEVEDILLEHNIMPLMAVVPDNRDPQLEVSDRDAQFWERVRRWQRLGWAIGVHGYQHTFATSDSGLVGINGFSEFSGLPEEEQQFKLLRALEIFADEQVNPDVWVAPAHSFDRTTVKLLHALGLRSISDGLFFRPRRDELGMLWIPQQLWHFRRMPPGVWTVCHHINKWKREQLSGFRADVVRFKSEIEDMKSVIVTYRDIKSSGVERFTSAMIQGGALQLMKVRRSLSKAEKRVAPR